MINRLGNWRLLWMTLAVIWTMVVFASGWINLPRERHVPHDTQFLSKLSTEAASILQRTERREKPVRGAIVWSDTPRFVRMSNGAQLTFPATTTGEQAAIVANEYRQLLNAEAEKQRVPYLLKLLAIWLAPAALLLVAAAAPGFIRRGYTPAPKSTNRRGHLPSSIERAVARAFTASPTDRAAY